jgi:acetylornithine/succinyldiaminopimelate/putrescine aminotransferase
VNDSALLPVYGQLDMEPVRGEGVWIHTADGRRVLDLYGGHAVAALGYGHPRLARAIREQADALLFQTNAVPMSIRERAGHALADFAPAGLDQVFLVNSGAEANENALRLALRATGRPTIVALEAAFHGRLAGCGAVTWGSERWYGFPRTPFDVRFVPRADPDALSEAVGPDTAAVILEPVQGVAGAWPIPPAVLEAARSATKKHGSLLIFDEVQSGIGRTGWPFAAQRAGITPDILTAAKSLGGGFPVGALLTTRDVAEQLGKGDLGTTFGGGPVACAAICAVLETIRAEHLLSHVREVSSYLEERCVTGPVTDIQGAGFLIGLRCARPAREIQAALLDRDILTGTSADPAVLRLLPPLILERAHVDRLADALEDL